MYQISFDKTLAEPKTEWVIADSATGKNVFSITVPGYNNIDNQGKVESLLAALDFGKSDLDKFVENK